MLLDYNDNIINQGDNVAILSINKNGKPKFNEGAVSIVVEVSDNGINTGSKFYSKENYVFIIANTL